MMSLKLPNYPREFIDAYVKLMTIQYIKRTIRESILDFIKDEYKSDLKQTFGTDNDLLINNLIIEHYSKEDYYSKIIGYAKNREQDLKKVIEEIVGKENEHLQKKVREGEFPNYKEEDWYKSFVLIVDKFVAERNIKGDTCELNNERKKLLDYIKKKKYILDFIKNEYKRYLKRTFGTASDSLIDKLIIEHYFKEDYYFKITEYKKKQGQDIENYIKEIIGTKNKHLLKNVREGKFSDYKQEEWYEGFVLFVDKLITERSRNIKELICELKSEEITNLVDYLSELILIHPKTMETYINGQNKKNPGSFERLKRLYNLTQDIELENKKEKINTLIVKNFINPYNKGLLVCPYCNRNYINDREPFLGAEMDHFYSKDKYPMFAVSLYNFIPSCSTCNHIKNIQDLKNNPFLKENNSDIKFDLIKDKDEGYKIKLICESIDDEEKENFKNDIYDVLKLDKAYQVHSIDIEEMVNREEEYGREQRKLLKSIFSETEGELNKKIDALIYGDIIFKSEDELINISLGKLKKDAYEKIKDWKNLDSNLLK